MCEDVGIFYDVVDGELVSELVEGSFDVFEVFIKGGIGLVKLLV